MRISKMPGFCVTSKARPDFDKPLRRSSVSVYRASCMNA